MAHLELVRHRTHHATYRKTVKIIIHKNQNTQDNRHELSTDLGFNMELCPFSKSRRSARLIHQSDHRP